jgi:hypothetical protein
MRWLTLLFCLIGTPVLAQRIPVDLELVLAVDGSASVDHEEFLLQMGGIANAFRDRQIVDTITQGEHGQVAVTLMIWSGKDAPVAGVDWQLVYDGTSSLRFAAAIRDMYRPVRPGATAINFAIREALKSIEANDFDGTRKIIDLSGDGMENNAVDALSPADIGRREAMASGVTINGLPIMTDDPNLQDYFRDVVVGGPGAFMMPALNYDDFGRAIREKLLKEIRSEPLIGAAGGSPNG